MKRIVLTLATLVATIAISQAADLGDYHSRAAGRHGLYRAHPRIVWPHYSYRARVGMTEPVGWYRPEPRVVEEWAYPEPSYPVVVLPYSYYPYYPYDPFAGPCGCY